MAKTQKSALAPKRFPTMPPVAGVSLATIAAGVRYKTRADVTLAKLAPGTTVAGVFTQNRMPGAPVDWCRRHIGQGIARALIVKAGNANVFTGRAGAVAVEETAAAVARALGCRPAEVFVASTGVIGEFLPHQRVIDALPALKAGLKPGGWNKAARAIGTTDTFAKGAAASATIDGKPVSLAGIAKGSGMIAPDMATMLAFLFTDARLPAPVLQQLLGRANARSFNCITVDGDTSTSDTMLLFATGRGSRHQTVASADDPRLTEFTAALDRLMTDLAHQVVRDGEGAEKFITITVSGAKSWKSARRIGLAIANSPLVKTAIAGNDANWGRIVMAVGKAGEAADRDRLSVEMGGVLIADAGGPVAGYDEAELAPHMQGREIDIKVDVGVGRGRATVWTCDLTHGYITINADYRS